MVLLSQNLFIPRRLVTSVSLSKKFLYFGIEDDAVLHGGAATTFGTVESRDFLHNLCAPCILVRVRRLFYRRRTSDKTRKDIGVQLLIETCAKKCEKMWHVATRVCIPEKRQESVNTLQPTGFPTLRELAEQSKRNETLKIYYNHFSLIS